MRSTLSLSLFLTLATVARAQIAPGQEVNVAIGAECPAGTVSIRPGRCRAPTMTPPNLVDYRPRSTVAAAPTTQRKAKFPVTDWHGHPQGSLGSLAAIRALGLTLDSLNIRVMVAADRLSGDRLRATRARLDSVPEMRDRIKLMAGYDFRDVGPAWAAKAVKQLEADVAAGAVAVGEIQQGFGLSTKKADGTRLTLNDPDLAPFWEACARLKMPVFIHVADPAQFFEPIDANNERWLELSLFPGRRYDPAQFPAFETLMKERDDLFRRQPRTTFVIAHLGWNGNDVPRLRALFDKYPNVYSEIGAVLYEIGRQPRAYQDLFMHYPDRILFGKDSFQPDEYPYFWRVLESRDDYFDYYRPYHAFWKLYGLGLPDAVLKKVYSENAARLMRK
ncbi:MAG: amidohydrolase [Gemmatimonadaceae bacterium]|nr:amidohydrolase [Gemmatimonadaceae bacterium]